MMADEVEVRVRADRQANSPSAKVRPIGDRARLRPDDRGLRGVVVRPDESDLVAALQCMSHCRKDQVDLPVGEHRDTAFRIDRDRDKRHAEERGDAAADVRLETDEGAEFVAHRKAGIVGAQADPAGGART